MRKATVTALKKSIATWERRATGECIKPGEDNCALCNRFDPEDIMDPCALPSEDRCPVDIYTSGNGCITAKAFRAYLDAYDMVLDKPAFAKRAKARKLAQAEVDFLKSLLPDA